ncbi:hypothetical protein HMN09_01183000 [Mycena chlorophos]|uniref:Uncharacterized protein n=1 Tax=Mycena chlorophos TaxID=658473 RepID=A0A8H6S6N4_MYCCL|nr:hypothetical protein HMN09_01183000 [Mycena chlorophos]
MPVDFEQRQTGPVALPLDSTALPSPASTPAPTPLRRFHRRIAYSALVALVIVSLLLLERPPLIGRGDDELFTPIELVQDYQPWPGLSRARDERLDRYWTPTSPGVQKCAEWTWQEDGTATAAFALPTVDFELLFLLSRAPVHGRVQIIQDKDWRAPFTVKVSASHKDAQKLAQLKACQVHHEEHEEQGILFWSPSVGNAEYDSDARKTREYGDLSTQLPRFEHALGELMSGSIFRTIRLRTGDADIDVASVAAETALIESTGGAIRGLFLSGALDIRTSNAVIDAGAMVVDWEWLNETRVDLWTSNAAIDAQIALVSDFPDKHLTARLHTSNAPLTLRARLMTDSNNSTLRIDAETTNAPASASLPPTAGFEGRYELQTSNAEAKLNVDLDAYDPSGRGRVRIVEREEEGDSAKNGVIYWKDAQVEGVQPELSSVKIRTSNAPVVFQI